MTAKRFTLEWYAQKYQELSEENEQLQQRNKRLQEKIQRERTSFTKTYERWNKEAEDKIKELSEENEELKQQLKPIQKVCKKYRIPIKDLPEILEEYIAYDNDDNW